MTVQTILVACIVLYALGYTFYKIFRTFKGPKDGSSGCGAGCPGCHK